MRILGSKSTSVQNMDFLFNAIISENSAPYAFIILI